MYHGHWTITKGRIIIKKIASTLWEEREREREFCKTLTCLFQKISNNSDYDPCFHYEEY